ncbi:MAG: hypothetical protein OSB66_03270 [SAR202 cluster bacterium]|nr:hypothetical protein [SAR202 cluster bacterium]
MTKKCVAARRRYKAKKAAAPKKRRGAGTFGNMMYKANHTLKRRKPRGAGLRRKRRRKGKGRGAGFWEDVGHTFEQIGTVALSILPMVL